MSIKINSKIVSEKKNPFIIAEMSGNHNQSLSVALKIVKGVAEAGADAIQVSNHGGRQLDSATAAINMLPLIRKSVGSDFPLIFDSGIRSGSDIVRALAFGADYAMIGRPVMYAMGADGRKGLRRIVEIIKEEASTTLGLVGLNDINDVTSNIVIDNTVNKVDY